MPYNPKPRIHIKNNKDGTAHITERDMDDKNYGIADFGVQANKYLRFEGQGWNDHTAVIEMKNIRTGVKFILFVEDIITTDENDNHLNHVQVLKRENRKFKLKKMKCKKHPKYQARGEPTSACKKCHEMWDYKQMIRND